MKLANKEKSLEEIGEEITAHYETASMHFYGVAQEYWLAGGLLIEAKERVMHGEFMKWCENYGFERHVVQRSMQIAEYYGSLEEIEGISLRQALKALPKPEKEADPNGAIPENVEDKDEKKDMKLSPTEELKIQVSELSEKLRECSITSQQESDRARIAEQKLEVVEEKIKEDKGLAKGVTQIDKLNEELRQKDVRIKELQGQVKELKQYQTWAKREIKKLEKAATPF